MSLKIAIGLGNSGAECANTRHNSGEIVLKEVARACGADFSYNKFCSAYIAKAVIASKPVVLAFADGYMNLSGGNIKNILKFLKFNISEAAVVYDDITLDVGRMKLSLGGSAGGHNGVADIMEKCGNDFARIRIGIGAKPYKTMDLADYVLGKLDESDLSAIRALDVKECLSLMLAKGLEGAQNVVNRHAPRQ